MNTLWADRIREVFRVDYHNPWLVAAYVGVVGVFLYGVLRPRRRVEWQAMGWAQAWVAALYAEMYGWPLTAYLLAGATGRREFAEDHFHGHAWAYLAGWDETGAVVLDLVGNGLVAAGAWVALAGWRQVHRGRGTLVVDGLYRWVRHPQYTGFFLFLAGSVINWPTLPTLLLAPVLVGVYARLAGREEADARARFGGAYEAYASRTGRFLPRPARGGRFSATPGKAAASPTGEPGGPLASPGRRP